MFVFDMEAINVIDVTGLEAMEEIRAELASKGIKFVVARAKLEVRDKLSRAGYWERIGATNFHPSVRSAVQSGLNEDAGISESRQQEAGSHDKSA
jgi:MFS superfamily sulfate permease-like transporter